MGMNKPKLINNDRYFIIGSRNVGKKIPEDTHSKIIQSLTSVVALKVEWKEPIFEEFDPESAEVVAKEFIVNSFRLPEARNMTQIVSSYGIPDEIVEVSIIYNYVREPGIDMNCFLAGGIIDILDEFKSKFGFINPIRGKGNFIKIKDHWDMKGMNNFLLVRYAKSFEKYLKQLNAFENWTPDLNQFKEEYNGKIAVCCNSIHTPLVQSVLDGKDPVKPDLWQNFVQKQDFRSTYYTIVKVLELC